MVYWPGQQQQMDGAFLSNAMMEEYGESVDKLNHIIPEDMKLQVKAFLRALQNQDLSAVVAGMFTEEMVLENLTAVGKKVNLLQA